MRPLTTRTTPNAIARKLNDEGERTYWGLSWTQVRVRRVLSNELYLGTRVVGRAQVRLGKMERRPEDQWGRVPAEPIISKRVFRDVQRRLVRWRVRSNDEMLNDLRTLLSERGRLGSGGGAVVKTARQ